jgi:DNA invertase Pin-like site-specific DNA recombinase
MVTAYIRTSTADQDGRGQEEKIKTYCTDHGVKVDRWEREQISTRKKDRRIYKLIDGMNSGDVIITSELSRLGRSGITEIGKIIEQIRERSGSLIIVNENMTITRGEMDIKTEAVLSALSLAGRIERDMISERTRNALQSRKKAGVKLGRPTGSKLDERAEEIKKYKALGLNITAISKLIGCTRATLYKWEERQAEQAKRGKKNEAKKD